MDPTCPNFSRGLDDVTFLFEWLLVISLTVLFLATHPRRGGVPE